MPKKTLSAKGRRTKGHNFERKVVNRCEDVGIPAERNLEYQAHKANGVDVETDRFAIQCKCMKQTPNIPKVFKEITSRKDMKVVIFKVDGKGEYACFKFEDALELMKLFDR